MFKVTNGDKTIEFWQNKKCQCSISVAAIENKTSHIDDRLINSQKFFKSILDTLHKKIEYHQMRLKQFERSHFWSFRAIKPQNSIRKEIKDIVEIILGKSYESEELEKLAKRPYAAILHTYRQTILLLEEFLKIEEERAQQLSNALDTVNSNFQFLARQFTTISDAIKKECLTPEQKTLLDQVCSIFPSHVTDITKAVSDEIAEKLEKKYQELNERLLHVIADTAADETTEKGLFWWVQFFTKTVFDFFKN